MSDKTELKKQELIQVMALASELQAECHTYANELISINPELSTQDVANVWIFKKLAELQLQIKSLTPTQDGK